jgi:hypothetical protein
MNKIIDMTRPWIYSLTILFACLALPAVADEAREMKDFDIVEVERARILKKAASYLSEAPRTVTADRCARSEGGSHDYYSEGDYWWPDPKKPDGPYMRRDGETNPDNFIAHRKSMIRLSDIMGTLASAYLITHDEKYAAHAVVHLNAWFVHEKTRMNPSLFYGQAIKGRFTGRSIGIIDTIKSVYLKQMMDQRGGFPAELKRTKPYGYSLFVIDAMAGVAQIASSPQDDLWAFELPDGRGMGKGMEFIFPYIVDKSRWPQKPDVMYWDEWPVRHPSLLFAGVKFKNMHYLSAWEKLESDPNTFEVLRNLPLRYPLLWLGE